MSSKPSTFILVHVILRICTLEVYEVVCTYSMSLHVMLDVHLSICHYHAVLNLNVSKICMYNSNHCRMFLDLNGNK